MSNSHEITIRLFDGVDKHSTLLIGKEAEQILFGHELPTVLRLLGFETRNVANIHALSEVELVTEFSDYTRVYFPEKTSVITRVGEGIPVLYQAKTALEIRPPITGDAIDKISSYVGKLAGEKMCDFILLDDRGKRNAEELYSSSYSAKIIPFPGRN